MDFLNWHSPASSRTRPVNNFIYRGEEDQPREQCVELSSSLRFHRPYPVKHCEKCIYYLLAGFQRFRCLLRVYRVSTVYLSASVVSRGGGGLRPPEVMAAVRAWRDVA